MKPENTNNSQPVEESRTVKGRMKRLVRLVCYLRDIGNNQDADDLEYAIKQTRNMAEVVESIEIMDRDLRDIRYANTSISRSDIFEATAADIKTIIYG